MNAGTRGGAVRSKRRAIGVAAAAGALSLAVFVPAGASGSTTLGSAVGGNECFGGLGFSAVQGTSAGPSYVVPGTGTLTSWSVDATAALSGTYSVQLEVWTPTATPGTYTLNYLGPSETITLQSGVNTFTLSPPVAVTAGQVIGIGILNPPGNSGDCTHITGSPGDSAFVATQSPPAVGGTLDFAADPGAEVDVSATFQPPAPPPPPPPTPSTAASGLSAAFTG